MRVSIIPLFLFYITLVTAWPWPANFLVRKSHGDVAPRDDPPPPSSSASPASSAQQNTASNTGSVTGTAKASGSQTNAPSKPTDSKGNHTTSISIDPESPAGGLSMVNPAPTTTTYYKFGTNITWVWNYTSLVVTPSAIDVLVSCQDTANTFTVAQNVSVNATQTIVWDTASQTAANVTDQYTLIVYDAADPAGISATPAPGKFGVADQFIFAMYTPQAYQAVGEGYFCVTCNGAIASADRQAIGVMLTMAMITVFSFTYFANGFMAL